MLIVYLFFSDNTNGNNMLYGKSEVSLVSWKLYSTQNIHHFFLQNTDTVNSTILMVFYKFGNNYG